MADREITVDSLTFRMVESGTGRNKALTVTLEFNANERGTAVVSWQITLPKMAPHLFRRLLDQLNLSVLPTGEIRELVTDKDFSVDLREEQEPIVVTVRLR